MSHNIVKSVLIVTKAEEPRAHALAGEITAWLAARGVDVVTCEHRTGLEAGCGGKAPGSFDLVAVLGGDGTLISVARKMYGAGLPLLGINLGRVGFLAEVAGEDWKPGMESILAGEFTRKNRMMLCFEVFREGVSVHRGLAVNDLVVSRGELARLIQMGILYDGEFISSLRADGFILATPTGSTAYGFSAGGPVVHPDIAAICAVPVCPFLSSFKPLVLPSGGEVRVRIQEAKGDVNLTEDGQGIFALREGDEVVVRRAQHDLILMMPPVNSYFRKLQSKGFITEV